LVRFDGVRTVPWQPTTGGALNSIGEGSHRRDALWQVQRAGRQAGPLLESLGQDEEQTSPLQAMNPEERMVADYAGTGITVGRHSATASVQELRPSALRSELASRALRVLDSSPLAGSGSAPASEVYAMTSPHFAISGNVRRTPCNRCTLRSFRPCTFSD
jgi:hypothetical protein